MKTTISAFGCRALKIILAIVFLFTGFSLSANEIVWEKCELTYKEKERGYDKNKGPFVVLETSCPNFPHNVNVTAFAIKLDQSYEILSDQLRIDENGQLKKGNEPFVFALSKFARGEPCKIVIVTKKPLPNDKMIAAELSMVPFPIEVSNQKGQSLSLQLNNPEGTIFKFSAKGYAPQEWLTIVSKSGGDKLENAIQASDTGMIEGMIHPETNSLGSGKAVLEIIQANHDSIKINYDWGKVALRKYGGTPKSTAQTTAQR